MKRTIFFSSTPLKERSLGQSRGRWNNTETWYWNSESWAPVSVIVPWYRQDRRKIATKVHNCPDMLWLLLTSSDIFKSLTILINTSRVYVKYNNLIKSY